MNYNETLNYIHSTPKFARVLGNELLRKLLCKLGNPHKKLKFIHIAGTNGKGSCAVMLAEILKQSGFKTGLFTSPFITRFNERIRINNQEISDDSLAEITSKIRNTIEKFDTPVSEFALDTAIAFEYFSKENCDIVVLETGLGGRLDATNVIENPLVTVLMAIDLDHTQYLGDTIEKITIEKCGIIKQNRPTVLYPIQKAEVFDITKRFCAEKSSDLYIADTPCKTKNGFTYKDTEYSLSLNGGFQMYNAATVLKVVEVLNKNGFLISAAAIDLGLKNAKHPARLEKLECGLIIDGAHNPSAVNALCAELKRIPKPICICISMMSDKDICRCVKELSAVTNDVIVTELDIPRCQTAEKLAEEFLKHGISPTIEKNPINAAKLALSKNEKTTVVCGSLYLASKIRNYFKNKGE